MRFQKIKCNVSNCTHNCLEDSSCRLDEILVTPTILKNGVYKPDVTMCGSFKDIGNLNMEEKRGTYQ